MALVRAKKILMNNKKNALLTNLLVDIGKENARSLHFELISYRLILSVDGGASVHVFCLSFSGREENVNGVRLVLFDLNLKKNHKNYAKKTEILPSRFLPSVYLRDFG